MIEAAESSNLSYPEAAVKGFLGDSDWMFKVGLGGIFNASALVVAVGGQGFGLWGFSVVPIVLIFMSLTTGFVLRSIRYQALRVEAKLPDWNEWMELFISGLTWLALQFGYWMLPVSVATAFAITGSLLSTPDTESAWIVAAVLSTAGCWLLVSFYLSYLMVNFAAEETVGAAFALIKVTRRLLGDPKGLIGAWLLSIGLQAAAIILPSLTIIGIFFTPSSCFASHVIAANVLARTWSSQDDAQSRPGGRPRP